MPYAPMLHFLSSLFSLKAERLEIFDDALVDAAIERAVDGTDPRLRAVGHYRKRLSAAVEQAMSHVVRLVEVLPTPVEISPRSFSQDPRIRALFVSTGHLTEVMGGFGDVRQLLADLPTHPPLSVYGLLSMVREERSVLAMALEGDALKRDVMQVSVSFSSHRYLAPALAEPAARRELKKRAFDFLIQKALERLVDERGKRLELDRQRHLLGRKLDAMKSGQWGLGSIDRGEVPQAGGLAALETEIEAINGELGQFQTAALGLEESLELVADTLGNPAQWLDVRPLALRMDYRGFKTQDEDSSQEIQLAEIFSSSGERRTVLFGRIAGLDLPEASNFWQTAKRYL